MNLSYISTDKSASLTYKITLPTYIDNIDDAIYYDYIVVKPTGTDCFIMAEPPNIFKFYHTSTPDIETNIPFLKICIPKIGISTKVLFHGTLIRHNRCAIHDMIIPNTPKLSNEAMLCQMYTWFTNNPLVYSNDVMIFAISHIIHKSQPIVQELTTIPYPIKHIEYVSYKDTSDKVYISKDITTIHTSISVTEVHIPTKIFTVYADIPPDIYRLYTNTNEYVGLAHIPDLATSKFMNGIFRNIKENTNLDLLEESDDESDFENTAIDKYVYLEKHARIKCTYNEMFGKWRPIQLL